MAAARQREIAEERRRNDEERARRDQEQLRHKKEEEDRKKREEDEKRKREEEAAKEAESRRKERKEKDSRREGKDEKKDKSKNRKASRSRSAKKSKKQPKKKKDDSDEDGENEEGDDEVEVVMAPAAEPPPKHMGIKIKLKGSRDDKGKEAEGQDAKRAAKEKAEQEQKRKEAQQQKAAQAVMACMQKLSDVTLDNFDALKAEFEGVVAKELPKTGPQHDTLKAESERVFSFAKRYVDELKAKQKAKEAEVANKRGLSDSGSQDEEAEEKGDEKPRKKSKKKESDSEDDRKKNKKKRKRKNESESESDAKEKKKKKAKDDDKRKDDKERRRKGDEKEREKPKEKDKAKKKKKRNDSSEKAEGGEEAERKRKEAERQLKDEKDKRRKQEEEEKEDRRREDEGAKEAERLRAEDEKRKAEEEKRARERKKETEAPQESPEERAKKLEELRRKKEEEHRRKEADLQRRREERRRKEMASRGEEEDKRRAERDEKRKAEMEKKREDEAIRKQEEARKKEEEAEKAQREAAVRREQNATLAVLRGLQRLSEVTPDNFQALQAEFEEVMRVELPLTGPQKETLTSEADRVFGFAQQFVEHVREQVRDAQEKAAALALRAKEQEAVAKKLLQEFQALVDAAESASEETRAAVASLGGAADDEASPLGRQAVLWVARAAEAAGVRALAACTRCSEFYSRERGAILEAEAVREESGRALAALSPRVQAALRASSEALALARAGRERVAKAVAPSLWAGRAAEVFRRHDGDGDGVLDRSEALALSEMEYDFKLPEESLDRIFRQLVPPGARGLPLAKLQQLKTAVGISRHQARGLARRLPEDERMKREEREAAEAEARASRRKEALAALAGGLSQRLAALEARVAPAEQAAAAAAAEGLSARAAEADGSLRAATSELAEIRSAASALVRDANRLPGHPRDQLRGPLQALLAQRGALDARLEKAASSLLLGRQAAMEPGCEGYESLRLEVAVKMQACVEAMGGKVTDLFQVISKGAGDSVTAADAGAFLRQNKCELAQEKVDTVFSRFSTGCLEGDGTAAPAVGGAAVELGRSDFMSVVRVYHKVVKETLLTDGLPCPGSAPLRSVEVGEVLEVLRGPVVEPSTGSLRISGRSLKDGQVGWVTTSEPGGGTFLVPGGGVLRVVRPCSLCGLSGSRGSRALLEGERLQVLDWSRTSPAPTGLTRVQARATGDGAVGWTTIFAGDGTRLLEPL
ncbi:unnamed protein product [Prorocentrum cordatum]|uniref:EF-hand domain-containing protein n=1 Tax=Prorocentrum cordatum TaxID=2364126 RepID=A0ABN9U4B5_9DINO|nr:unnamed protein product [Polarella glacialis]